MKERSFETVDVFPLEFPYIQLEHMQIRTVQARDGEFLQSFRCRVISEPP